jgi:hypothetical protein
LFISQVLKAFTKQQRAKKEVVSSEDIEFTSRRVNAWKALSPDTVPIRQPLELRFCNACIRDAIPGSAGRGAGE